MSSLAIPLPVPFNRQDAGPMPRLRRKGTPTLTDADAALVARLREGDESAFAELIDSYGATMLRVAQMYVRDRAGGRTGDLARRPQGHRPLRGPLEPEDLALPDPQQPGEDERRARRPHGALLLARGGGRRRRAVGRPRPLPRPRFPPSRSLGRSAAGLAPGQDPGARDAGRDPDGDRRAARGTARGDSSQGRGGVEPDGG